MSLLSKSEIQFIQGQKHVSKCYEYKLKSVIKKKISNLLAKELPLLSNYFSNLNNLTEFSKDSQKVGLKAKEKLQSPVKHCGLSSRRSRVQIPAGASLFVEDDINTDKNIVKDNKKMDNSLTLNIKSNLMDADRILPK
jgi:hypothetical protein